jgi:very-short-patch-repair endonuclease
MVVMKIYLAGKIGFKDWRNEFVNDLCNHHFGTKVIKNAIRNRHDYVGPFFIEGQHGGSHGDGTHGAGESFYRKNTHEHELRPHKDVWENAMSGIRSSDVVIAVVTDDAHGTLCEIGFAYGIGKPVYVIGSEGKDCWFAKGFCIGGFSLYRNETVDSILDICDERDDYDRFMNACESPAEVAFARTLISSMQRLYDRPIPQHQIGPYRVDFAFVDTKLVVEIDGIEFHGNQAAFIADRKRTRYLEANGWQVIRFAAKEVLEAGSCEICADEVWNAVGSRQIQMQELQQLYQRGEGHVVSKA